MNGFLKIKSTFIKYLPLLITISCICFSCTIFPPQGYAMTISSIELICFIFWCLFLGRLFGILQCFFIGTFTDLIIGTPLGSYILLFTIIRFISCVVKVKFKINSFLENIIVAMPIILIFYFFNYIFVIFYHSIVISSEYFIFNIVLTILLYPSLAVFFHWICRITSIEKYYVKV